MGAGAPQKFRLELLDADKHDRHSFTCGIRALDVYLKRQAHRDVARRIAVVMVLTRDGRNIDGYYTLQKFAVDSTLEADVSKVFDPHWSLMESVLLRRLASSRRLDREFVSEVLLMAALKSVRDYELRSGPHRRFSSVVVEARSDRATEFYRQYGFVQFSDFPEYMFLPMKTVLEIFAACETARHELEDKSKEPRSEKARQHAYAEHREQDKPYDNYSSGLARYWRKRAG